MSSSARSPFSFLILLLISICCSSADIQTYIVHVHKPPPEYTGTHRGWHESFLSPGPSRLLYSYGHAISGFAARLTEEELHAMRRMDGFLHAEPNRAVSRSTTRTPTFLGLHRGDAPRGLWKNAGYGKGMIIGVIDGGISPNHPSFDDQGMPPPPPKWKGKCESRFASLCNNKLVGIRVFNLTLPEGAANTSTPLDGDGHGTHTAGIAAGRPVESASVLGAAMGTATGMAPDAHLAIYKVCGALVDCFVVDVLAGIDSALQDGVDVISMSLSGLGDVPLYNDFVAVATFGAVKKGIVVSISAGNTGPGGAMQNAAPWLLTVGASTLDRRIRAVVKLGNGSEFQGESAYQPKDFPSKLLPLVYPTSKHDPSGPFCSNLTTLQNVGVKGKVVLCVDGGDLRSVEKGKLVKGAGGAAMILMSTSDGGFDTFSDPHVIPASHVSFPDGLAILAYHNSTAWPTATLIFKGTVLGVPAPAVAAFSASGPSSATPGVLKPDIIGPGVNVLSAWPFPVGPFPVAPSFNFLSGTSMSCPHLSGIAALLKNSHPDWSPAMVKSAIMTTTDLRKTDGTVITDQWRGEQASFFAMGAGHVNPARADNPGLVYDIHHDHYVAYLCSLGYTDAQVSVVTHAQTKCATIGNTDASSLNYPSLMVTMSTSANSTRQVNRIATNVGEPKSSYTLTVNRPFGFTVMVHPRRLSFTSAGQKESFAVRIGVNSTEAAELKSSSLSDTQGTLEWVSSDGKITVRSPLVIRINRKA